MEGTHCLELMSNLCIIGRLQVALLIQLNNQTTFNKTFKLFCLLPFIFCICNLILWVFFKHISLLL